MAGKKYEASVGYFTPKMQAMLKKGEIKSTAKKSTAKKSTSKKK